MKAFISVVGVVLIIFGIVALGYQGFMYKTQEKVAQIGDVQITTEKEKMIHFNPVFGGLSLVAGIVLVVVGRRKN